MDDSWMDDWMDVRKMSSFVLIIVIFIWSFLNTSSTG